MIGGKRLIIDYTFREEEHLEGLTPADVNYLFGMETDRAEIIFYSGYDFTIAATSDLENFYTMGVDLAIRKKLDELQLNYTVRLYYE